MLKGGDTKKVVCSVLNFWTVENQKKKKQKIWVDLSWRHVAENHCKQQLKKKETK